MCFAAKCYQCAYNPADVEVDHIQVPRTVYDEIQVPRTVYDEVQVPRVVYDDVTVTHVEYDEVEVPRVVYEEVQVPRVAYETTQVPRIVEDYVQPMVSCGVTLRKTIISKIGIRSWNATVFLYLNTMSMA